MELVAEHKDKHGLTRCLDALDLARSTWYYRRNRRNPSERDRDLKRELIKVIKAHPEYGYRRLLPELRERTGRPLNHKRLRRVLKEYELGLMRCLPKHQPSPVREILKQSKGRLDLVRGQEPHELLSVFMDRFGTSLHAMLSFGGDSQYGRSPPAPIDVDEGR